MKKILLAAGLLFIGSTNATLYAQYEKVSTLGFKLGFTNDKSLNLGLESTKNINKNFAVVLGANFKQYAPSTAPLDYRDMFNNGYTTSMFEVHTNFAYTPHIFNTITKEKVRANLQFGPSLIYADVPNFSTQYSWFGPNYVAHKRYEFGFGASATAGIEIFTGKRNQYGFTLNAIANFNTIHSFGGLQAGMFWVLCR